jgi:hypothetical protein
MAVFENGKLQFGAAAVRNVSSLCCVLGAVDKERGGEVVPAAWDLHPDFGVLCVSERLCRKLRLGLFCLIGTLAAGIVAKGALFPGDDGQARHAFALAPSHGLLSAEATRMASSERAGSAEARSSESRSKDAKSSSARAAAKEPVERRDGRLCPDGSSAYFEAHCTFGTPQRTRAPSERPIIAAVPIGRVLGPDAGASDPALPLTLAVPAEPTLEQPVEASVPTAAASLPVQSPQPAHKSAHRQNPKQRHAGNAHQARQGRARLTQIDRPAWSVLW